MFYGRFVPFVLAEYIVTRLFTWWASEILWVPAVLETQLSWMSALLRFWIFYIDFFRHHCQRVFFHHNISSRPALWGVCSLHLIMLLCIWSDHNNVTVYWGHWVQGVLSHLSTHWVRTLSHFLYGNSQVPHPPLLFPAPRARCYISVARPLCSGARDLGRSMAAMKAPDLGHHRAWQWRVEPACAPVALRGREMGCVNKEAGFSSL